MAVEPAVRLERADAPGHGDEPGGGVLAVPATVHDTVGGVLQLTTSALADAERTLDPRTDGIEGQVLREFFGVVRREPTVYWACGAFVAAGLWAEWHCAADIHTRLHVPTAIQAPDGMILLVCYPLAQWSKQLTPAEWSDVCNLYRSMVSEASGAGKLVPISTSSLQAALAAIPTVKH
jgi:hypothetical protein